MVFDCTYGNARSHESSLAFYCGSGAGLLKSILASFASAAIITRGVERSHRSTALKVWI